VPATYEEIETRLKGKKNKQKELISVAYFGAHFRENLSKDSVKSLLKRQAESPFKSLFKSPVKSLYESLLKTWTSGT